MSELISHTAYVESQKSTDELFSENISEKMASFGPRCDHRRVEYLEGKNRRLLCSEYPALQKHMDLWGLYQTLNFGGFSVDQS